MSKLLEVAVQDLKESPSNPRKSFDEIGLQELAESIKSVGLLQPLVVMPAKSGYEIVCGHRRYRASKLAEIDIVPAMLRDDLTPEQALELQITENLQRKDVHPLDEAIAFKRLQDERKYSIEEVANRVGKSERFVIQRMKLNDLIGEIQEPFYANKISLTQAFMIARMTESFQVQFFAQELVNWKDEHFHLGDVSWKISRTMLLLENAKFDLSDASLYPKAGSCLTCPKNTACSTALFPEEVQDAKCTDRDCFNLKEQFFIDGKIRELENAGEDFYLLYYRYNDTHVVDDLKEKGYKLLEEYDDFRTTQLTKSDNSKVKTGLWVNSSKKGEVSNILLSSTKAAKSASDGDDLEVQISKIEIREKRAKELDAEKVYEKVHTTFNNSQFLEREEDLNGEELRALASALIKAIGWYHAQSEGVIFELMDGRKPGYSVTVDEYDLLVKNLDRPRLNKLLRLFVSTHITHFKGMSHERSRDAKSIYEVTKMLDANSVAKIEFDQQEIRSKREERVAKRIEKIRSDIKKAEEAKPPKKKAQKPVAKKKTKAAVSAEG